MASGIIRCPAFIRPSSLVTRVLPSLLAGPSLSDLIGGSEVALLASELSQIEWRKPAFGPTAADAVRLIQFLRLDAGARSIGSVGDAEVLQAFLRDARRATPTKLEERGALAALSRYLSTCEWIPSHLSSEHHLRANALEPQILEPPAPLTVTVPELPRAPSPPLPEIPSEPEATEELPRASPPEDLEFLEEEITLPAPQPFPPEPIPLPEPPLPTPEPYPEPQPEPEPEPEPEEPAVEAAKHLESPRILLNLAKVMEDVGERAEVVQAYEQVLQLRPNDAEALAGQKRLAPSTKSRVVARKPAKKPRKTAGRSKRADSRSPSSRTP